MASPPAAAATANKLSFRREDMMYDELDNPDGVGGYKEIIRRGSIHIGAPQVAYTPS
jgi:hypothetical protein